jgi:hypothetical protein
MHVHVQSVPEGLLMRTTIEMKPEHRAKLLELAAHRGAKGFSQLVSEALEAYLRAEADREAQRKRAVLLKGAIILAMMVADSDVLIAFLEGRGPAAKSDRPGTQPRTAPDDGDHALRAARRGQDGAAAETRR